MGLFDETPAEQQRSVARRAVENSVWRLAEGMAAGDGVTDRDGWSEERAVLPGPGLTRRFPVSQYNLPASVAVLFAAREQLRRAVADARGSGMVWDQVGEFLGLGKPAEEAGISLARAAWRLAAMDVFPGEPDRLGHYARTYGVAARWRCWACDQSVTESDIDEGVAAQKGHRSGCSMFARERAAQKRRWEEEG